MSKRIVVAVVIAAFITSVLILFPAKRIATSPRPISNESNIPPMLAEQIHDGRIDGWKTYENTKYTFSVKYPPEFSVFAGLEGSEDDQAEDIVLNGQVNAEDRLPEQLYLNVIDPGIDTGHYDLPGKFWSGPLDDVVQQVWRLAQRDEQVGSIVTSSLGGQLAYEWVANNGIGVNGRGRMIDEQHLWLFAKKNDRVFELSFPDTHEFRQIVSTFQFTQ